MSLGRILQPLTDGRRQITGLWNDADPVMELQPLDDITEVMSIRPDNDRGPVTGRLDHVLSPA